eukprot:4572940-Pyramimonas_sp.AAC.1
MPQNIQKRIYITAPGARRTWGATNRPFVFCACMPRSRAIHMPQMPTYNPSNRPGHIWHASPNQRIESQGSVHGIYESGTGTNRVRGAGISHEKAPIACLRGFRLAGVTQKTRRNSEGANDKTPDRSIS